MTEHDRRSSDAGIARIEQQIEDLKELVSQRETACQRAVTLRLDYHDREISKFRDFMRALEAPIRFVGWAIVILVGGILAIFGSKSGRILWAKFFE